jgi:predicted acyl esterase
MIVRRTRLFTIAVFAAATACAPSTERGDGREKISEFGRYEGYSTVRFEEFARSSVYVPAEDGTRLAVDVYRPSKDGAPADEPLPAVLSLTRYVSADVPDHEVTVYLEEVEADGYSRYLTQNSLMASHRTLGTPKFSKLELPWATSTQPDVDGTPPLTDGVAELQIVLEPVANLFNSGHRIRVTITGADADLNWSVPRTPPARLTIHRSATYPSRISLPIVD